MYDAITDVPGIKVGHYTDLEAATGCTVILCQDGAIAGVDVRGSAPGTRETDLLRPMNQIERIYAVILSGGSAFGLDAAGGVVLYLEERDIGVDTPGGRVPIVSAAVLFDLTIGNRKIRPGLTEGYQACLNATDGEIDQGCVGAGTGAMVGQLFGPGQSTKSGLGTSSRKVREDVIVAALVAVNALGDVIDPKTGKVLAGLRSPDGKGFYGTVNQLGSKISNLLSPGSHTTIGVVSTNARLTKEQVNKVAQMAHDGMARAINPVHTMYDGDTLFALSLGKAECDVSLVGAIAAEMVQTAIIKAVKHAVSLGMVPAIYDIC